MKTSKILLTLIIALLLVGTVSCSKKHKHTYSEWQITATPTETAPGKAERECSKCSEGAEEVEVAILTDTSVWSVEVVGATCLAEGTKTYTSTYGTVVVDIPIVDHAYSEWKFLREPTESRLGSAERTCTTEGCDSSVTAVVPVLLEKSTWSVQVVDATCLVAGSKTYTSVYGTVVVEIPMLDHAYSAWTITTEPTEEATGIAERTCTASTPHVESVILPVLTDTSVWNLEVVEATCQAKGSKTYTSTYGTVVVTIPISDHSYDSWIMTTEPTDDTVGAAERTCTTAGCDHVDTAVVPVLTDTSVWNLVVVDATYNEAGSKTYTSVYGTIVQTITKLVAPYDNKTYNSFAYEVINNGVYNVGAILPNISWTNAEVTLDENGVGIGTEYPFTGEVSIKMIDPTTGKIQATFTYVDLTDPQNPVYDRNQTITYDAYVDFETGIIVTTYTSSLNYIFVITPFGALESNVTNASSWDNALLIDYTYEGTTHSIYATKTEVFFNVSFETETGAKLVANTCYNAPYVYVKDADGNLIKAFGHNGEEQVVLDGYQGTYTADEVELVVSGFGTMTYNGVTGTYEVATTASHTLDAYVGGAYYEVTLTEDTYSILKPMVDITFEAGVQATIAAVSVNKNIAYQLPNPTHDAYVFKGWYYDENYQNPVEENFIPTSNTTLYALWLEKVLVNLSGVITDDPTSTYIGNGDTIYNNLPQYNLDEENRKIFKGWYTDPDCQIPLSIEAVLTNEDAGITIYAKWEEYPPYSDVFKGTELSGFNLGNSSMLNIDINGNGVITGSITGIIVDYNPENQLISYKENEADETVKYMWFDEETGVLTFNSTTDDGIVTYVYSKYSNANLVIDEMGIYIEQEPGSATKDYFARLITINVDGTPTNMLIYNEKIYNNISIKSSIGTDLTIAGAKLSKTVVVSDLDNEGNVIVAVYTTGTSFENASDSTQALDSYFGVYTKENDTITLDGMGNVIYGEKTGTYQISDSELYGFDVYLANNTEYYELTLDGTSFTILKAMVTITYVTEYGSQASDSVNKNIEFTLPVLTYSNYIFKGWYEESTFINKVDENYLPTADVTLYAYWDLVVTVTVVYGNGLSNSVKDYIIGETIELEEPEMRNNLIFEGWYTDPNMTIQYTPGQIESAMTIYCKWQAPIALYGEYKGCEIDASALSISGTGGGGSSRHPLSVDPYGVTTGYKEGTITKYDPETGAFELFVSTYTFYGYYDAESGLLVLPYRESGGFLRNLVVFVKGASSCSTNNKSYWNNGFTQLFTLTLGNKPSATVFYFEGKFYYNVTFTSTDGSVEAKNAHEKNQLSVFDRNGVLIASFVKVDKNLELVTEEEES